MIKRILKIMGISMIIAFPPLNFSQVYDQISFYLKVKRDEIIINSEQNLTVRAGLTAQISAQYFSPGDEVKEGDLLLRFNDAELKLQKELQQKLIARFSKSMKHNAAGKDAAARIEEARILIEIIENKLKATEVRAPQSGKILRSFYKPGQYVQIGEALMVITTHKDLKTLAVK